jgi:hypothetical protein
MFIVYVIQAKLSEFYTALQTAKRKLLCKEEICFTKTGVH